MINSQNMLRPNQGGVYISTDRDPKKNNISTGIELASEIGHRISDKVVTKSYTSVWFCDKE